MNIISQSAKRTWRCKAFSLWDVLCIKASFALSSALSRLSLGWQGCHVGKNFRTSGPCSFKARTAGSIRIGDNVTLLAHWRTNRVGLCGRVLLHTLGDGQIEIGDHTGASSVVISSRSQIKIGRFCKLGGNVRIFDHDFHALDPAIRRGPNDAANARSRPITIGDDVFIGTNAVILKGVTIGDRSIIGAGVVVNFDVPPDSTVTWENSAFKIQSKHPSREF